MSTRKFLRFFGGKAGRSGTDYQYWMRAIANGARTYEAHWEATEENIADFDGLVTIAVGVKTRKTYVTDEAYIWIEYGFLNQIEAFDELDDVL